MIGADRWIYRNDYPLSWGWFKFLPTWCERVTTHLWQRLRRGYSCYDMYNGETFIADVISNTAYELFVHTNGHPDGMTYDEWLDLLLDLREAFTVDDDIDWTPPDWVWDVLRQHFKDLWD